MREANSLCFLALPPPLTLALDPDPDPGFGLAGTPGDSNLAQQNLAAA